MKHISLNYQESSGYSDAEIQKVAEGLKPYIAQLQEVTQKSEYDGKETSINASFDDAMHQKVIAATEEIKNSDLEYIFLVGIGGSNLGAMAVSNALEGASDLQATKNPQIIALDTVSPFLHKSLHGFIKSIHKASQFAIILVSKSGSTTETIANFEHLYSQLKHIQNIDSRVICVSQPGSPLWEAADQQGFKLLEHPNIGGRFSVLSTVGQLPLTLAGFNTGDLICGAKDIRHQFLSDDHGTNMALTSAILLYLHNSDGRMINNNFFFNPEMEGVGKWYRQLIGESLGKEQDTTGNKVNNGIIPIVSIGSTDLHSMVQLYFGGPRNMFTNFVYSSQPFMAISIPEHMQFPELVKGIQGKNMATIMDAIYEAVKIAYKKKDLPFMEVQMPEISEYTLGQYFQFKMFEAMYLAKLMKVNAFDQPNVEDYKSEMRHILNSYDN